MQIERITSRGQLVALTFMQNAVAASQTDAQLPIVETAATDGTTDSDEYLMPFDGDIVAITAELSAAAGAGTLTLGPTIDGTENTSLQLSITTATEDRATAKRGAIQFSAGDRIGCEMTTTAGWDATTADIAVQVWVLLAVEGI